MIVTTRMIVLLFGLALATGGTAWGVHSILPPGPTGDRGSDSGLDTDGNGKFEWLVVEAEVRLPKAGSWDIYGDLSTSSPPASDSCGFFGTPPPAPMLRTAASYGPIAWVYERYFFPAGLQTVRMAFPGADIARAAVDGPYLVHARLTLGGFPDPRLEMPVPIFEGEVVEWNYTTHPYSAAAFEPPVRPAYFVGPHSDRAIDVDSDGLADVLQLTADIHVNAPGNYSLSGTLWNGTGSDLVRMIAFGSSVTPLDVSDAQVSLRFRGDQIRAAGVDGPWNFVLTLFPFDSPYLGGAVPPSPGAGRPDIFPVPEMLCGATGAHRAADFDDTPELLQYTGHFEETLPDLDRDGLYDALVVRAEVDVFVASGFDLIGTLRPSGGATVVARSSGQAWLSEGHQWAEFAFLGPEIRASRVDGPYEATISLTPIEGGRDPTATYTTQAYKATEFDDSVRGARGYEIGNMTAESTGGNLAISVRVVRAPDMLAVVMEDVLVVTVADAAGAVVGTFKDRVYLPSGGSEQTLSFALPRVSAGTYAVTAVLGSPDRPVDLRTIRVTV